MSECIAEWHLRPKLREARRIREQLADVLADQGCADIDAFQLACAELIVNLSRYPDPKPTEVILRLSRDEQDWWLELKDNGPSFNNFSQLLNDQEPLEASERGMGLKLLAQLFSDIRYVPACYRDDACNLMVLKQPIHNEAEPKRTILVVDDDMAYRSVINAYLANDYKVVQADSVQMAYSELMRHQPDLVICDIQMPGQDGTELFDQITHIPDLADMAFIYLSGTQDQDRISRALSRPTDDFLTKPVTKDHLLVSVERVIQRRGYLKQQIRHELEQKASLGLQPSLPHNLSGFNVELRTLNPEPGGGDLVQLHRQEDNSTILMADLMGHGLGAKGYSYALAGYLRGLTSAAHRQHMDLPGLFRLLSQGFNEDELLQKTLATLIAVKLSSDGTMEWVNAGQPYPLMMDKESVCTLRVEGALPGMGVDDYESVRCTLQTSQRILFFSDGFLDAGEPVSEALEQSIRESMGLPISAAADYLLSVRLQAGRTQDDLTMILLEKT